MQFLRAKEVRMKKRYSSYQKEQKLYTTHDMEQKLYVDMGKEDSPDRLEVVAFFDTEHPAPKKVSISANQYTLNPFEIKISLYKKHSRKPYVSFTMGELRSVFDIEENTSRITLEFINVDNERRFADVKLIVNYAKF